MQESFLVGGIQIKRLQCASTTRAHIASDKSRLFHFVLFKMLRVVNVDRYVCHKLGTVKFRLVCKAQLRTEK